MRCFSLALLALMLGFPAQAHAQLTVTSQSNYGTYPVGVVELPLTASGGTGTYTWSIFSGTPPAGLALRADGPVWFPPGAYGLSGVATSPSTYSFTVQVSDGVSTAQQLTTVKITALRITTPNNLPDAFANAPYSFQLAVAGAGGTPTWAANGPLPSWLALSNDGVLTGTSPTPGFFNVPYSVTDGTDTIYGNQLIRVSAVQITTNGLASGLLPYATINQSYNQAIDASGGSGGYTWGFSGGLPNGVNFSGSTISGTPTQSGRSTFSLTATDSSSHSYTKNMSLVVVNVPAQLPQVTTYGPRLDDCSVGVQCSRGIGNWTSAQPPFSWTATGLPAGMSLRFGDEISAYDWPGDAEVWGTPGAPGDYSLTVTVTDGTGAQATNIFPLHISALWQQDQNLSGGTLGAPYFSTLRVLGGSGSYTGTLVGGTFPLGLTLSNAPLRVSGTPLEGGSFNPQFTFADGLGNVLRVSDNLYIANAGSTTSPLQINTNGDLGSARTNQAWFYALSACCRASIVWSFESGALPSGVSLSAGGVLSGTPTVSGLYTFVVRAADGSNAADYTTRQLTVRVTPVFVTTNSNLPFGNVSTLYSTQLQASGGTGPYTWTLAAGSLLPPGLTLTSTGLLSGTPLAPGQFNFTVNVLDVATLNRTTGNFSIAIYPFGAHPPLAITTNGNFGTASIGLNQFQLTAQNGTGTYTWSLLSGTLPPGLAVRPDGPAWFSPSASGGVIGIATTPGTYAFTLQVSDGVETRTLPSTLKIVPLTIKELWTLPDAFQNVIYAYTLSPLGNVGSVTWGAAFGMPPGLSINPTTGVISGTPTTPGFYNVQVSIAADGNTIFENLNIGVFAISLGTSTPLAGGVNGELPNAVQGQPYSAIFTASGGAGSYTFSSNSMPNGLTLTPAGVVVGNYSGGSGRFTVSVTATSAGVSYTRQFAIRGVTSPAVLPAVSISGQRFDDCTIGMGCSRNVFVSSGAAAPFTWSPTGLPPGMSLRTGGVGYTNDNTAPPGDAVIWGTPTQAGDFNVTISVTDATGAQASNTFPLHVSELYLDIRLNSGQYGTGYSSNLRILGGSASYSTALAVLSPGNRLPLGLSLNGVQNRVTGLPVETGFFSPDLLITDTASPVNHTLRLFSSFSIAGQGISTVQINTGSDLGYFSTGSSVNFQFNACCLPSMTWSQVSGLLPPGTSLSASGSGQLTGTPNAAGTYTFVLRVQNTIDPNNFAVRQFTLVVTPLLQNTFTLPFGNVGTGYNQTLQNNCASTFNCSGQIFSLAPYNALPPGLNLNSGTGLISGTPAAAGQFNFNINVADAAGHLLRMNVTLSIYAAGGAPPLILTVGPTFGPQMTGQLTVSLSASNTSGGMPPYHYSLTPGANVIPGMRVQDGQPLPTSFATSNPIPTAAFIGVLDTPGVYTTSIRVSDSALPTTHVVDRAITITVSPLSILAPSQLPKATVGSLYSFVYTVTGGTAPYTWTASSLPAGLSMNPITGELSGTPTAAGSSNPTVIVTDSAAHALTYSSSSLPRNAFAITTGGALPAAPVNVLFTQTISATGCGGCTWSMPNGPVNNLSINASTGVLSGIPSSVSTVVFTIRATATGGVSADKVFSLTVNPTLPQALSITNGPAFSATTIGAQPTNQLNAIGGTPPYTWSLAAGALPSGVSLVNGGDTANGNLAAGVGYLVGRAIQTGTYAFTLRVTDSVAATFTRAFTWNISTLNLQYTNLPLRDLNNNLIGPALTLGTPLAAPQPMLAIGGTSNYTWTATLPAGLTLNAASGVINGTPLDGGTFNVPVTIADDGGHSVTSNVNMVISTGGAMTFNANATQGPFAQSASVSINLSPSGGTPPYTVSAVTPLPPGFALQSGDSVLSNGTPGSSYFLAGTPLASGVFAVTLQLQDSASPSHTTQRTFTIPVSPVSIFTGSPLVDGSVGAPYAAQLVAFDGAGSVTWGVNAGSGLPAGLTLSGGGLLSGTPTAAGAYSFTTAATDSATGLVVPTSYSLKVSSLGISGSSVLLMATVLQPYTYTFAATGAVGPVSWSISANGLPSGLNVSGATISGTPLGGGSTVSITATATSGADFVTRRFTLFVRPVNLTPPGLPLVQTSLPDSAVGQLFSVAINPNGGLPPYTWSVAPGSSLPPGLSLLTGAQLPAAFPESTFIGGQPTAAGNYSFDLIVSDANGTQARRTFSLHVSSIAIVGGTLRTVLAGVAYSQQLTAVGGTPPYTFTASLPANSPTQALLPPGMALTSSGPLAGLLSGTTTSTGIYNLVIRVQDSAGNFLARTYALTVNNNASPSAIRVTSGNLNDVYVGSGLGQNLVTNSNAVFTWSLTGGALPLGVFLTTDPEDPTSTFLTGQPSLPGIYTYTLRATQNGNPSNFAEHAFTMNVSPMQMVAPSPFNAVIPAAQVGVAYSATIKVAGGTPPYAFTSSPAAPLPTGLSVGIDGSLSGTPTSAGLYSVGLVATDLAGRIYHLPFFTLSVTPAGTAGALNASQQTGLMDDASVGSPYRFALTQQRGGAAPYSWTLTAGSSLPPGLTIMAGGNGVPDYLAGVPTTTGTYNFSLTVSDAAAQSIPVLFTLGVSPLALTPDNVGPGRVGVFYSATLAPLGGVGPYTIEPLSDWDLPPGLSFSAGVLSGTPTAPGLFVMRVQVTDNAANSLSKIFMVAVDNAAGESPAVTMVQRSIALSYTQTFPDPGPIAVGINTTSGTPAFSVAIEGVPGATMAPATGTAPGSTSLNLHVTTLGVGTYSGVLALAASGSTNQFDAIPVTVTVMPVPPCNYNVSPTSTTIGPAGGTGTFDLVTSGPCSWTASVSQPSWISLTTPSSGNGATTVGYTVTAHGASAQRSGTITINGAVYTITQFGSACSFALSSNTLSAPASGGTTSVGITASDSICGWNATGLSASPASGTSNETVTLTIPANPNPGSRLLNATIAGLPFTVTQSGIDCTVAIDPSVGSFSDAGGIGTASITTPATCGYSTTSNPSWVTLDSGASGTGDGTLHYTVAANSATAPRTGSVVISGQALTISQGAAACSVTLDTSMLGSPFGSASGGSSIDVITNGDNCAWSVSSNANWATFAPNASSGNGTVSINVAANPSTLPRSAIVSIAGQSVTVFQAGQACSYALQSTTGTVPAAGGSGTVGVLTPSACSWNPVSSDPGWLTASSSGVPGSGDASFIAAVNASASSRTATLTIAGLTYTVTQAAAACAFTLGSPGANVSGTGVIGASFTLTSVVAGCAPVPVSYASWLTITNVSFAGTSGSVTYSVQPNPLSAPRSGFVQVGDQTFAVTQNLAAAACRYSLHAYGASFSRGGGGGDIFGSGSAVDCDPTSTIGTDQPGFISLLSLTGPVLDIFTQPFNVAPFDTPLTAVIRRGRITFGGQIFVVKQVSW
jgi:hypothetical protein